MNQLDFSPISQKDEQSLDTFSFLHNPMHSHRPRTHQAGQKLFQRLNRMSHNRQCYSFQLLKQFILFSSDQETIQIHYRYTQYELEQGTQHLENSYGMRLKLTLGKTFQDIRNYSRKRKVYENPVYVEKLVSVYDRILKLHTQESYKCVIKILASFIEKQVIDRNGQIKDSESKPTIDLIETLEKEVGRDQQPWEKEAKVMGKQRRLKDARNGREDLLKTAKLSVKYQEKDRETSHWKQQVQNVDSYQQQAQNDHPRLIIKSMSNQIYDYPYKSQLLQSSSRQPQSKAKSSRDKPKPLSISITNRSGQNQDVFQTKRKQSSASISRNEDANIVQNVIIIRGHKEKGRQPDRYIRVPVVSDQVKIVEMIPEADRRSKKNGGPDGLARQLETISSGTSRLRARNKKENQIHRNVRQMNQELEQRSKIYEESDTHECLGCKYCQVVKQMQSYRLQRTSRSKQLSLKPSIQFTTFI